MWKITIKHDHYLCAKINILSVKLTWLLKSWFHEFFSFLRSHFLVFFHTALTKKIFRQINSLVISFVKTLLSRIFCQECVRPNRSNFHIVYCCVMLEKITWNQLYIHAGLDYSHNGCFHSFNINIFHKVIKPVMNFSQNQQYKQQKVQR